MTGFGYNVLGFGGARRRVRRSVLFNGTNYLSISDANFGGYNKQKFALAATVKMDAPFGYSQGSNGSIAVHFTSGSGASAVMRLTIAPDSTNALYFDFSTSYDGSTFGGNRRSDQFIPGSTTDFHHVYATHDSTQAVADDRMRMWIDGTEITSFNGSAYGNPALNDSVFDATGTFHVGADSPTSLGVDGRIFEFAMFSGSVPSIGDVHDTVNSKPKDVRNVAGLYALLDGFKENPGHDFARGIDWTESGSPVTSEVTPL